MGDYLNISKSLTTPPPALPPPLSPPPPPTGPALYFGLAVVATAAIVISVYNLIIVHWCITRYHRRSQHETQLPRRTQYPTAMPQPPYPPLPGGGSTTTTTIYLLSSFKYKKEKEKNRLDDDVRECSICLSTFEEGEEVKKLPICNHFFHASCIDMWLHSHIDCPLCRAPVEAPPPPPPAAVVNV